MSYRLRLWAMFLLATAPIPAGAYELLTHREIAIQAAQPNASSTDEVLKKELGIRGGIAEVLLGQGVGIDFLIGEGALSEDSPLLRRLNHFHNPLLSWDAAGLRFLGLRFESSVVWQQNRAQDSFVFDGGNWSWQDARQRYLSALTGVGLPQNTKEQRDLVLADTFRTLGHLTHLIQDASVPAHSRNDQHVIFEGYETWADRARRDLPRGERALFLQYLASPIKPPLTIFAPGRQEAPIPIARLIDSDRFDPPGNFGPLLDPALGIAEYSNGNFLSDDTIFQDFVFPRRESLDLNSPFLEPDDQDPSMSRRYFPKVAEGQRITHFVAESALYKDVSQSLGQPISDALTLTRRVYRDYAAELLPRAVGYSATLLDYFFRGKLQATIEADPVDPQGLQLTVKNASPEALRDGTLEVWGDDYAGGERKRLGTWQTSGPVSPGADLPGQPLKFTPDQPIPTRYMVVYKGDLGEEKKEQPETATSFVGGVIGKAAKYGGIIETIFSTGPDEEIYFRDSHGVTNLELRRRLPGTYLAPSSIQWGHRDDSFLVQTVDIGLDGELVYHFHVVTLDRPGPGVTFDQRPTVKAIRTEAHDLSWYTPGADVEDRRFPYLDANNHIILSVSYQILSGDSSTHHAVLLDLTTKTVLLDINGRSFNPPVFGDATYVYAVFSVLYLDPADPKKSRIAFRGGDSVTDFSLGVSDTFEYLSVIDGEGSVVMTMLPWTQYATPISEVLSYRRTGFPGTRRHMAWGQSGPPPSGIRVFLSSFDDGVTREIVSNLAEFHVFGATYPLLVAPDYLLRVSDATPAFVKGWGRDGAILLDPVSTPGFPAEDSALAPLKRLADLPPGVIQRLDRSAWHVVEDPDLLK